jgi:hypothetical protein
VSKLDLSRRHYFFHLVIIDDLDVKCVAVTPPETDPPLLADPDAVLALSITLQRLKLTRAGGCREALGIGYPGGCREYNAGAHPVLFACAARSARIRAAHALPLSPEYIAHLPSPRFTADYPDPRSTVDFR